MAVNGPHIIPLVYSKVTNFPDTTRIWQALTRVNRKDSTTKLTVVRFFDMISGGTSAGDLQIAEDLLMEISFDQQPKVFFVNEGEDFCLQIDLEVGRDFTGSMLTLRDEAGVLLSPNNIAGDSYANAPIQYITITDLSLTAGSFYRANALLETPVVGVATGLAETLLTKIVLIVEYDIDV